MDNVTLRSATLSLVRTLSRSPLQKPDQTPDQKIDQKVPPELDPEVARRLKEARETAAQASKTLEASRIDVNADRKKAAREKLSRIREQLRTLKMVAGDPKTAAHEGARLARELSAAVKEYAAAGGGQESASTGVPATPAAAAEAKTASGGAAAKAPADADAAATAETEAAPPPDTEAAPEAEAGVEDAAKGAENAEGKPENAAPATPGTAKDGTTDEKTADNFADDARNLSRKLRAFLRTQVERLKSERGVPAERALKDVTDAMNELKKTESLLNTMPSSGGSDPTADLDITV
ncbi:hypothetical protein [Azospirillum sp. sgz301742]